MSSKDAEKTAPKARADRRKAEREQRLKTGKSVKISPSRSWIKSKAPHN